MNIFIMVENLRFLIRLIIRTTCGGLNFGRWIYSSTSAFKTKFKSPLVYRNNLNAVYPEVFEFNEGMYLVEWVKEEHLPHLQDIPFGRCRIVINHREFVLTLMKYLINNFGNREITFEF